MVACVLVCEEEGHVMEIESPLDKDLYTILKGTATFVGGYPELDVVILRCEHSHFHLLENRNRLPPPFDDQRILGPILLVRMDAQSEPQDFTLEEYQTFIMRDSS
jgi:hypothetical protein